MEHRQKKGQLGMDLFIRSLSVTAFPVQGCGDLQPVPADTGQEARYTLAKLSSDYRVNIHTDYHLKTVSPAGNRLRQA